VIRRLHHAQITIPRGAEAEARRFYCDLLGLAEVAKPASLEGRGGFWLRLGDHLAYEVSELGGWRERLEAAGVEILESVPIPGCERFEFRDPFGNRVEFLCFTAGGKPGS
jgi:catechol 2,3-dioxygenase-like lactoylglutathione lyase family enzyme